MLHTKYWRTRETCWTRWWKTSRSTRNICYFKMFKSEMQKNCRKLDSPSRPARRRTTQVQYKSRLLWQFSRCTKCKKGGWVKPDIVFFGEGLPARFHKLIETDFDECDLCITMGTSLYVQPFASLPSFVNNQCHRIVSSVKSFLP